MIESIEWQRDKRRHFRPQPPKLDGVTATNSPKDIPAGTEFGLWKVLYYDGDGKWMCRCACGIERPVRATRLRCGGSKKCGKGCTYKRTQG